MAVQTTGRERKKKPRGDLCTDKSGQQREKKSANQSVKILCFPNSADFYFIFKYITEETACRRDLITFLSTSANSRLQLFQPKTKPPRKLFMCREMHTESLQSMRFHPYDPWSRSLSWVILCTPRMAQTAETMSLTTKQLHTMFPQAF